jgi:hypothetical protein
MQRNGWIVLSAVPITAAQLNKNAPRVATHTHDDHNQTSAVNGAPVLRPSASC